MTDYGEVYADEYSAQRIGAGNTRSRNHAAGIAAVVAAAKVEALEESRDKMMPPLNWNLDPWTGCERPGTANVDEVYHDVYVEMSAMIDAIRTDTLAAAHATDLREQSKHYAGKPMNSDDGRGE